MKRIILTFFILWTTSVLFATEQNFKALLLSIEKYEHVAPLGFAENDIEKFGGILSARYG